MWVEGEDGVICNSLKELVQSFHARIYKFFRKPIHHALHHKLLWQRLDGNKEGGNTDPEKREAENINRVFVIESRTGGISVANVTYRNEVGGLTVLQLDPQPVKVLVAPSQTVLRQVELYPRRLLGSTHSCCVTGKDKAFSLSIKTLLLKSTRQATKILRS